MTAQPTAPRPRVVLLDDHALFRHAMAVVLSAQGFEVVQVDPARDDLAAALGDPAADLVLLDLALADGALGTDLLPVLLPRCPRVLALTGETDPLVKGAAMLGGCRAVLPKAAPMDEILEAVRDALDDRAAAHRHADPAWAAAARRHRASRAAELADFDRLTAREGEVLAALVAGRDVTAIAAAATVSVTTVRSQVRAVLTKLGVGSQLQAVARARRVGWGGAGAHGDSGSHQDERFHQN